MRQGLTIQVRLVLMCVAQAVLKLAPILLPQPPKYWDYRREPPLPAHFFFFKIYLFIFILFSSFCFFIYSFISMAGSACPRGGAGTVCGAWDRTMVPAAAVATTAFLSRNFRPLSHPAGPEIDIFLWTSHTFVQDMQCSIRN